MAIDYFIKEIPNNDNINKYFYVDKVIGILEIKDGKWYYNLSFFCINNFYLPPNSLLFDIALPSQTVSDICINLSPDQSRVSAEIKNNQYCKIYDCNFQIVVDGDNYFNQPLNKVTINHKLFMNFDPSPLNACENNISQDVLNSIMNEIYNQKLSFDLIYSNIYYCDNDSNKMEIDYKYDLSSITQSVSNVTYINYELNNYLEYSNPIVQLCSIESLTAFSVIKSKVSFYYTIDRNEPKNITYETNVPTLKSNNFSLDFIGYTTFDPNSKNIIHNLDGVKGFYCPERCSGYYNVELLIEINGVVKKLIFKNDFNFRNTWQNYLIYVQSTVINDLRKFRKVIF